MEGWRDLPRAWGARCTGSFDEPFDSLGRRTRFHFARERGAAQRHKARHRVAPRKSGGVGHLVVGDRPLLGNPKICLGTLSFKGPLVVRTSLSAAKETGLALYLIQPRGQSSLTEGFAPEVSKAVPRGCARVVPETSA